MINRLQEGFRILGIDPGSRVTGFGIIEIRGGKPCYLVSGCVRTQGTEIAGRIKEIFDGVREVTQSYKPQAMAIESVFMSKNADSALKLGQARGAAICAAVFHDLPVNEYSATQVKQAVVGKGNAAKVQVQHMITALLKLPAIPQADAADALAVALCHCNTLSTQRHLLLANKGSKR